MATSQKTPAATRCCQLIAGLRLAAAASLLGLAACSNTPSQQEPKPAPTATVVEKPKASAEAPTRPFPADSFHDLLVAEFAVRRNRYDLALGNYLQQAHQTRDTGVTARATRLAQFLQADKATLDAARLWVELAPDNIEAQYTTATMLAKGKQPVEALKHMTTVLEKGGKTNFAAIAASALTLDDDTRNTIEQSLDELFSKYPDNTQIMTAKSLLLQQRGETEAALSLIGKVLTLNEDDLHAVVIEARLLQQLNRKQQVFTRLQQVVERHPTNRRLRLQYARILMANNISLAKEQFKILLKGTPNDPDLLLSLGLISKETQHIEEAKHYFERLLATGKRSTESHLYLGQLAEQQQQWQTAIDHYKFIPPGTDFLAAINRIAALYIKQGNAQAARQHLQSLRQQYPEHSIRLYLVESELLISLHQLEQGHKLLSEALLINPQQPNLLYARSVISEQRGDLALMEQDLRLILTMDSDNAIALNTLGYVLTNRTDRHDEAYELISKALSVKPGDPAILDSLGWVEYRRGNLQQSLDLLTQAYKAFPDHEVAAHLGEVLWQLGEQQKAEEIWQQALERTPDSKIIRSTMQRLQPKVPATGNNSPP